MSLGIVILNWNNGPDTIACLRMVQAWNDPTIKVWVVDNASQDGSAELIAREWPDVQLIQSDVNRGFGGGTNLGIAAALRAGSEAILLLNNDAAIDSKNLALLRETLRSARYVGVIGPLIRDREHPERILSAGGRDVTRHLVSHLSRPPNGRRVYPVDYVPGTVALIRADLLRKVGLLNEGYFFGVEMVDLCGRARRVGYESVIDAQAVAFHSLNRSSDLRERLHIYYVIRNRLLYIRNAYHEKPVYRVWLLFVWITYSLGLLLVALAQRNQCRARAIWLAVCHFLSGTVGGQNDSVLSSGAK